MAYFSPMKHWHAYILFIVFFVVGLLTYKKYGIAWDEEPQHTIGRVTYDWLKYDNPELLTFKDRDYGVAFELPLIALERFLNLENTRDIYYMRHIVAHTFFLLTGFAIYFLAFGLYKKRWVALLAFFLYLLQPVLYAHSFFNTKDIPMMGVFAICLYLLWRFHKSQKIFNLFWLAMTSGLLVNLRLTGLVFVGLVCLYFLIWVFQTKQIKRFILYSTSYIAIAAIFLVVTWPYLYTNPIANLSDAFTNMIQFRWQGQLLYFGEFVNADDLPWHYLFGTIGVTNSIVIVLLFFIGCIGVVIGLIHKKKEIETKDAFLFNVLFLVLLLVSFGSVLLLKPVLYDSWRQFFYLYPAILLLAIAGLQGIAKLGHPGKWIAITIGTYVVLFYAYSIFTLFPYSQVFYSEMISHKKDNIKHSFDIDYWGTVYQEMLWHILETDDRDEILIQANTMACERNVNVLTEEQRKRLKLVWGGGDYYLTCFRSKPYGKPEYKNQKVYYDIIRWNNTIGRVYKLKREKQIIK